MKLDQRERMLRSLAQQQAVKVGETLTREEMQSLAAGLFACSKRTTSPNGKPALREISAQEFERFFEKMF
jgi:DNA mismatch repair protein MutL